MVKVRQDAWSHEDDLLLAETVLRHIREGSTQLNAFEEVGDQLNRTAAACGFRWNAEVRKNYEKAVDLAKRQRKQRKKAQQQQRKPQPRRTVQPEVNLPMTVEETAMPVENSTMQVQTNEVSTSAPSIDSIIHQLNQLKTSNQVNEQINSELEALKHENEEVRNENEQLKAKVEEMSQQYASLQEDYQTFINIMDRARKMMVFDEDEVTTPSFKMEKNGNLQQIAK
ncbi:RsfA family transcriptional regulator [Alkalibacillus haloalkaliphilus]|uniref:Prespore-specific transcriptional regulator RsfA n=1 Tax=Alkalibacillus haloalkaliphilus TaxID=94136 RepID=A0A511W8R8_9BACI|nr:RsfA family transcriptional regulator [Alkalibacillus haloalkaliphilus]GEN46443.1 prespore-specific transcriptional regulator RsfA [Alkalibacillus haloalkaliphilus]